MLNNLVQNSSLDFCYPKFSEGLYKHTFYFYFKVTTAWAFGLIVGPAIGGYLSEVVASFI
jgi:hypothetical protein